MTDEKIEVLPDGRTVGERLQILLDKLGVTPRELGKICGFKELGLPDGKGDQAAGRPGYVELVIRGRAELTPARAERIERVTTVNMSWLLHGVGRMDFRRNPNERDLWECAEERKDAMYSALCGLTRWDLEYLYEHVPPPEEEGAGHASVTQGT